MTRLIPLALSLTLAGALYAQTPNNIEAAEYDPTANRWFISNGSSILETSDGGASYAYFGSGSATHGMEVVDGHLFAIGNNVVRAYDLVTADLIGSLSIPGAAFLNGMGSRSGELVISDFSSGKLHRIDITDPADMATEVLVNSTGTTPNGVVIDEANNRAIVVNWGGNAPILEVDLATGEFSTLLNSGLGNLDGIDMDGAGQFYVSSWSPARITRYSNDFSSSETVVQGAASGLSSPADISYAIETDTLGVANSGNDAPSFHYFGTANAVERLDAEEFVRWTAEGLSLSSPMAGTWHIQAFNYAGQLLDSQRIDLPNAPTLVPFERLNWDASLQQIWQITAPSGRQMPGQEIDGACQRVRVDAVAKAGPGDTLRLDALRRHRRGRGLHHAVGHHLVVGAMDQHHRRPAIDGRDPVAVQKRAGKADKGRGPACHAKPAMKAHHAAL